MLKFLLKFFSKLRVKKCKKCQKYPKIVHREYRSEDKKEAEHNQYSISCCGHKIGFTDIHDLTLGKSIKVKIAQINKSWNEAQK